MAHEIYANDRLLLHREKAWHGLGLVVDDAHSAREAQERVLPWRVEQETVRIEDPVTGGTIPVAGYRANVRSDTREVLAIVGDGYRVVQNDELARLIDGMAEGGKTEVESCGSLRGGRTVFFLVKLHSFGVGTGKGDENHLYALFADTKDGSRRLLMLTTNVRVVCANTERAAIAGSRDDTIAIRHSVGMNEAIVEARDALLGLTEAAKGFEAEAHALAGKPLTAAQRQAFFLEVYEAQWGRVPLIDGNKAQQRSRAKAAKVLGAWSANMDDPKQLANDLGGTAYAALNAVTQWADHDRPFRAADNLGYSDRDEARIYSNVLGTGKDFKKIARTKALVMV